MSFSARVKEELSHQLSKARHCQIAELAAILSLCGKIHIDEEDHFSIRIPVSYTHLTLPTNSLV